MIEILHVQSSPVQIIQADAGPGLVSYPIPTEEFGLSRFRLGPSLRESWVEGGRLVFLLVTRGQIALTWNEGDKPAWEEYLTGQAVLLPAILDRFLLKTAESAEAFLAEIPISPQ
jgi:hypothetical protein